MKVTERVYVSRAYDGRSMESAGESISYAFRRLEETAARTGRTILWDTLEISIETETVTERGDDKVFTSVASSEVRLSALGVRVGSL